MEQTHLALVANIAGQEIELRIFRHCIPAITFYTVDMLENGVRTASYTMSRSKSTGDYKFNKGMVPYDLRKQENEISAKIKCQFYNYGLN